MVCKMLLLRRIEMGQYDPWKIIFAAKWFFPLLLFAQSIRTPKGYDQVFDLGNLDSGGRVGIQDMKP